MGPFEVNLIPIAISLEPPPQKANSYQFQFPGSAKLVHYKVLIDALIKKGLKRRAKVGVSEPGDRSLRKPERVSGCHPV